jgi:hypothetical protein
VFDVNETLRPGSSTFGIFQIDLANHRLDSQFSKRREQAIRSLGSRKFDFLMVFSLEAGQLP